MVKKVLGTLIIAAIPVIAASSVAVTPGAVHGSSICTDAGTMEFNLNVGEYEIEITETGEDRIVMAGALYDNNPGYPTDIGCV